MTMNKKLPTYIKGDVTLAGSILAKDIASTENVELSSVKDANGKNVLRMVDAAPFAYDVNSDSLKITDTNVKIANKFKFALSGSLADGASLAVWTPATDKRIRMMGFVLSANTTGLWEVVELLADGSLFIQVVQLYMAANSSQCVNYGYSTGIPLSLANRKIGIRQVSGGVGKGSLHVWGVEE